MRCRHLWHSSCSKILAEWEPQGRVVLIPDPLKIRAPPLFLQMVANIQRLLPRNILENVWILVQDTEQEIDLPCVLERAWYDVPTSAVGGTRGEHGQVLRRAGRDTERSGRLGDRDGRDAGEFSDRDIDQEDAPTRGTRNDDQFVLTFACATAEGCSPLEASEADRA